MATIINRIKQFVVDENLDRLKEGLECMDSFVDLEPSYESAAFALIQRFLCHMNSYDWDKAKVTVVMGNHIKRDDPVRIYSGDDLIRMFRNPKKEIRDITINHGDKDLLWKGRIYTQNAYIMGNKTTNLKSELDKIFDIIEDSELMSKLQEVRNYDDYTPDLSSFQAEEISKIFTKYKKDGCYKDSGWFENAYIQWCKAKVEAAKDQQ